MRHSGKDVCVSGIKLYYNKVMRHPGTEAILMTTLSSGVSPLHSLELNNHWEQILGTRVSSDEALTRGEVHLQYRTAASTLSVYSTATSSFLIAVSLLYVKTPSHQYSPHHLPQDNCHSALRIRRYTLRTQGLWGKGASSLTFLTKKTSEVAVYWLCSCHPLPAAQLLSPNTRPDKVW